MTLKVVTTLEELRQEVVSWRKVGHKIGFVPTMGNLHDGHLSLVKNAQTDCEKVVVSIFVNPLQFGEGEDFATYPRTFKLDQEKLTTAGVDLVFYPTVDQMYPNGQSQTQVKVPKALTELWEGALRPGHFDGVSTVVTKLFNMVQPDLAVFGQKDFQQCAVIQRMVADLALPLAIRIAPIGRDVDGLALSSRNQYLVEKQRQIAPKIYQELQAFVDKLKRAPREVDNLTAISIQSLLKSGFDQVDYFQLCDAKTLLPVTKLEIDLYFSHQELIQKDSLVVLVVARLGKTRLLDNILL